MSEFETRLRDHAERIPELLPHAQNEANTRALLVEPVLSLLGYTGAGDIHREVPVPATNEFLDFELRADGRPLIIVEAKSARGALTEKHAGQCVQYAAVLGIPWCVVTNGTSWALYNANGRGPLQTKKIAQVRLNGSESELEEAHRVLSMLSKEAMTHTNPLTSLMVERVVADELSRPESPAVTALRRAVKDRFGEQVGTQAVLQAMGSLRGLPNHPDVPPEVQVPERPRTPGSRVRTPAGPSAALQQLVEAGLLPPDATIECRLYGVSHAARVREGKIELDGNVYDSPSAAASALRAGKSSNGWVVWKYQGVLLADLRSRLPLGGGPEK